MHALVVGGTGMLRAIAMHCAKTYADVSVLARSSGDLDKMEKLASAIRGIAIDYHDVDALRIALTSATKKCGRFDLAVVWVHDDVPATLRCIAEFVGTSEKKGTFLHVRSSTIVNPSLPKPSSSLHLTDYPMCHYQEVILGFLRENNVSRWLNHKEITAGIIGAMESKESSVIVGAIEPWKDRPLVRRS